MYGPGFGIGTVLGNDVNDIETTVARSSCVIPTSIQVLAITHEKADLKHMDDWLAHKFAPLQVLFLIGRSYKAEPMCHPKETLYDLWKDLTV